VIERSGLRDLTRQRTALAQGPASPARRSPRRSAHAAAPPPPPGPRRVARRSTGGLLRHAKLCFQVAREGGCATSPALLQIVACHLLRCPCPASPHNV
jgi:hypothetical protein